MIAKKTKYALKAMINLAMLYDKGPILIADLAREEKIPKKFLELILLTLKNHGILQSKKGKGGGYYLGKSPAEVSMGTLIRIFEGPLAPVPCVSESAYETCSECRDEQTCGIRLLMREVRDATAKILDNESLADVLERVAKAQEKKEGISNYVI
ncbi:MAG: Rrf2 family transcriptional regulator [Syntrophobacterales bacterium]|nr:Rrf2 family transcriptional regulator [Syntrophobacterales bacterium]